MSVLLLVPTALERERLLALADLGDAGPLELCGFGPVLAAARTAGLLAQLRPQRVLLLGIAGTYDPEALPVGSASEFGAVCLDGVGAGEGAGFEGPAELFPQWAGDATRPAIVDRVELAAPGPALVSVCAASADARQAARRVSRYPGSRAEDMEGFGVAAACALAGVPCSILRGISNVAGERDKARWELDAALNAVGRLAARWLADPEGDTSR